MTRYAAAVALAAGVLATAAPVATACDLEHCPWSAPVCQRVSCDRPTVVGCFQPLGVVQVCV